ncbi:glycosyltransferase family 29 protein [Polycladidibacter stylochi]|uniref:glycosyltransferase family 29 protein n=1 Tax=Polycladidibacter stylochi TaxID=1807766 RepID=UPI00138F6D34|nr:glycosyltransferase family 29 protein [Pseudovibrio stylochi]
MRGAAVSNEINAVFRYADYITQINSYEEVKLELFEKLFFNHEFSTYLNNSQRIKAITILIKNNHLEIARNIYDQLTIKSEATLPVFLQHVVYINKWRGYKNCLNGSRLYIKILESRKYFEEHISNNRNSICIVGNGTLGLSNKSSDDIDSNDVIIRFNNYDVNQEKRCGKKQNVWVRIANGEIKSDFSSDNKFTIIASNNFENKRLNPLAYYPNLQNLNGSFTTIPSEIFRELISSLNCLPSTGLALLYWIYKINGEFPKEKIYGFSHFSKDNDFDTHYYTDIPERIIHYHNWQREADFFQRLIK